MVVVIRCDRCGKELEIEANELKEFDVKRAWNRIWCKIDAEVKESRETAAFELVKMLTGKFILCEKCMEEFKRKTAEFEKKFMLEKLQEVISNE